MSKRIRLGTRGSKLALLQANIVKHKLSTVFPDRVIDIVPISTRGDVDKKTALQELGGKGVFIKELEIALLEEKVDIAVHSLKDVTTELHPSLILSGFLSPEAITDTLISSQNATLETLPKGACIGTGSMRRKALLSCLRPDITCVPIRGNVETRLQKCDDGDVDAVILSTAGLIRMGLEHRMSEELSKDVFIPAPGQGVIALECRKNDDLSLADCLAISDEKQTAISRAEYHIIESLHLHCGYPFGIVTHIDGSTWSMTIFLMKIDFSEHIQKTYSFQTHELDAALTQICAELKVVKDRYDG